MKKDNMYRVTNPSGNVSQYFNCRQSAIDFIVDEFAMAITFRTDQEGEKLAEYMLTHNETPNQYPYKYMIEEVYVNHDYDQPKSVYMVKVNCIKSYMQNSDEYLYYDYDSAKKHFDNIIDEDLSCNGEIENMTTELSPTIYDRYRWIDCNGYYVEHLKVELIEFIDKHGKFEKVYSKCQS